MDRRTFVSTLAAAGAALPLLNQVASAQTSLKTKNVVFVHGLLLTVPPGRRSSLASRRRASIAPACRIL